MAAQHTPGPWWVGEGGYADYVFAPDGYEVMQSPLYAHIHHEFRAGRMGDGHWGTTPGAFIERDEGIAEANARLTAAAPDLLEALRWFINDIDSRKTSMVDFDQAVLDARAAIAKAEGRS